MNRQRRTLALDATHTKMTRRAAVAGAASAAALSIMPTSARSSRFHAPNLNFNRQAGELNVMYLYVPYMEAIIPKFEEETGIAVNTISTYASNDEWWAKLNAGEETDFLIASTDWVQRAMAADLFAPIDLGKLSNLETLQPEFQQNEVYVADGESYAVPWTRVYYSLIYNTNEFSEAPTSWDVTWDETYKGKISVMDQAYARVATTALYLGQDPLAPDDPDAIREALLEQKPLVPKYWSDFQNGMEIFLNEEAVVGQLTAGRTRMAMSQDGPVNWTVPEEGCVTFIDTFAIARDAENVDAAHQFIDFLIRPDNMAEEMRMMFYDTVSAEAGDELPEDIRAMFEVPEDANLVLTVDLPTETRQMMDELWEEVKLS